MKKLIAIIATATLLITGCSSGDGSSEEGVTYIVKVKMSSGRVVDCVVYSSYNQGGISCDFGGMAQ